MPDPEIVYRPVRPVDDPAGRYPAFRPEGTTPAGGTGTYDGRLTCLWSH